MRSFALLTKVRSYDCQFDTARSCKYFSFECSQKFCRFEETVAYVEFSTKTLSTIFQPFTDKCKL